MGSHALEKMGEIKQRVTDEEVRKTNICISLHMDAVGDPARCPYSAKRGVFTKGVRRTNICISLHMDAY